MLSAKRNTKLAVGIAVLASLLLVAMPAQAANPVTVKGYTVNGGVVTVNVKNASLAPATAVVFVQANVGGIPVTSSVPVALLSGQCAIVAVGFTSSVGAVLSVGISDDNVPI